MIGIHSPLLLQAIFHFYFKLHYVIYFVTFFQLHSIYFVIIREIFLNG